MDEMTDGDWNPLRDHYNDQESHCYVNGPGAEIDLDRNLKRNEGCKLHVSNLPARLTETGVHNLFSCFGEPKVSCFKAGVWAYVQYGSLSEAQKAMRTLHNRPPLRIKVKFARSEASKLRIQNRIEAEQKFQNELDEALKTEKPANNIQIATEINENRIPKIRGFGRGSAIFDARKQFFKNNKGFGALPIGEGFPDIIDSSGHIYKPGKFHQNNRNLQQLVMTTNGNVRHVSVGRAYSPSSQGNRIFNQFAPVGTSKYQEYGDAFNIPLGFCQLCKVETSLKCSKCGIFYCSKECQKKDYSHHTTNCSAKECIDVIVSSLAGAEDAQFGPPFKKLKLPTEVDSIRAKNCVLPYFKEGQSGISLHAFRVNGNKCLFGPVCFPDVFDEVSMVCTTMPDMLNNTQPDPDYRPEVHDLVAYRDAESWWRAQVLTKSTSGNSENIQYQVALCDKGYIVTATLSELRQLPAKFEDVHFLAVSCQVESLYDSNIKLQENEVYKLEVTKIIESSVHCLLRDVNNTFTLGEVRLERWDPLIGQWKLNNIPLPSTCEVVITAFHDQTALYVRPSDRTIQQKFFALMQKVAAFYFQAPPLSKPPRVGEMVVCQCKKNTNFYRSVIIGESTEKPGMYNVAFIDFGNNENVQLTDMRALSEELKIIPCFAVKVSLAGVSEKSLTQDAYQYLHNILEVQLKLRFVAAPNQVDLFLPSGVKVNDEVNSMLVPFWKKRLEKGEEIHKVFDLSELESVPLSEEGAASGRVNVFVLQVFAEGSVAVCPVENPELDRILITLTSQINEYCEDASIHPKYVPRVKEICLAKYSDGMWYRAVCLEHFQDNETCEVLFIDYGNLSTVKFTSIRKIPLDFMRFPRLVSFCEIDGILSPPSSSHVKFIRENLVPHKIFEMDVISETKSGSYRVKFPILPGQITID